ncbi:MAG: 16S rRNA (cytosine(967)-C(5))-methyltransferase RsmB [Oscillospiraceae bacterium]|nr:16S rRNA (cytosine(967)-C(5))-methyltransferase RsmB [Oscillospiraceae bacterium]
MSARDTALAVLIVCRRSGAWSDAALKQQLGKDRLDRRDAALATRLCGAVLQNRLLLDEWISSYLKGKLSSLQPVVLDVLRLAVCQLRFFDKLPPSAVVDEAVNQAKRLANPRAAGLVNGLLRSMLRDPSRLTLPEDLSVRYSHPKSLVDLLRENVGAEKLEALLQSHNQAPAVCAQVNRLRTDADSLADLLQAEGMEVSPHSWLPDCLLLSGGGIEQSAAFRDGLFYVQDPAAKLAVLALEPKGGERILDCCAAPGGKSFAAAICMGNKGSVTSCDIHPHKLPLMEAGAKRLGITCLSVREQDASRPEPAWLDRFDRVIADVPCSGLGVIRKKPDIRYKDLTPMEQLPLLQRQILEAQAKHLRPGGTLVYSTCTVLRRENEAVVEAFLADHPDFSVLPLELPGIGRVESGMKTLLPCDEGTDGFFIAKLRKNEA